MTSRRMGRAYMEDKQQSLARARKILSISLLASFILILTMGWYEIEFTGYPDGIEVEQVFCGFPRPWLSFTIVTGPGDAPAEALKSIEDSQPGLQIFLGEFLIYFLGAILLSILFHIVSFASEKIERKQSVSDNQRNMLTMSLLGFLICTACGIITGLVQMYSDVLGSAVFLVFLLIVIPVVIGTLFIPVRRYFAVVAGSLLCILTYFWGWEVVFLLTKQRGLAEFEVENFLYLGVFWCFYSIALVLVTFTIKVAQARRVSRPGT